MHHIGTITKTTNVRPFHAQCSCGPAGDFAVREDAAGYLQYHFGKQGGVSTTELVDKSEEPPVEVVPVPGVPGGAHIGGIGVMPALHAAVTSSVPTPNAPPAEPIAEPPAPVVEAPPVEEVK
jgi:hypothetical protein